MPLLLLRPAAGIAVLLAVIIIIMILSAYFHEFIVCNKILFFFRFSSYIYMYMSVCNIWPENAMPAINNKRARGKCKYVIFCRLIVNIIDIERNLVVGHTQMHIWRSWILTSALTWAVFLHTHREKVPSSHFFFVWLNKFRWILSILAWCMRFIPIDNINKIIRIIRQQMVHLNWPIFLQQCFLQHGFLLIHGKLPSSFFITLFW